MCILHRYILVEAFVRYPSSSVTRATLTKASLILTMMLASASRSHERMGEHPASSCGLFGKMTASILHGRVIVICDIPV